MSKFLLDTREDMTWPILTIQDTFVGVLLDQLRGVFIWSDRPGGTHYTVYNYVGRNGKTKESSVTSKAM